MSSFLMWSFLVLSLAHLSILISVVCSLCVIGSMLASLQMSSFLMWSFLVLPLAHLSILISVVCSLCVIGSMLASLQMSSFLMWFFLVLPLAHLSILISVICWFNVGFSPDVFFLDVVLLGPASSPSQHSHLSGLLFLCIVFLD